MRLLRRLLASAVLAGAATLAFAQQMPIMEFSIGIHRLSAEVAATDDTRIRGLMHRTSLPTDRGMLFVFTEDSAHCMWMRNTLIPLSVAFLDKEGRILNIEDMAPRTETNHCAARPARYALEMNLGWFRARGLAPGAVLSGIERAPVGQSVGQ